MAAQNLWYYRDQIFRIVEESLEVSLVICTTELSEFTLAKIFDVFNQVLPTGFVLNTGYWPFYNTLKKQSICVCARYGIDCRHFKHDHHWIDLESIHMDNSTIFSSRLGQLCLLNAETEVTPVTGGTAGYTLNIKLTFQYKKIERGRPRRKKDENLNINQEQVIAVAIYSRFNIQREYYPAVHTIMFQPSPFFYETYGSYFSRLLHLRPSILTCNFPTDINQRYYTASAEHMPHFSLILQHVNLPLFTFSKNMHAVYSHLEPPRIKKMTHNKGSQTEDQEQVTEMWKYKEMIGNLKPIWNDSRTPSCESIFSNTNTTIFSNSNTANVDFVFGRFLLDDRQVSGQCTITEITNEIKEELAPNAISESILNEADHLNGTEIEEIKTEPQEIPASTSIDPDYDVQWPKWGYQKVVAKKRGKKKNPNSVLYRDVAMGLDHNNNGLSEVKTEPGISNNGNYYLNGGTIAEDNSKSLYATVLKSPKKEDAFEYTAETRARVYETYKDDPDFLWFETQFPTPQHSVPLSEAQINENFDIAEEFIREEMAREKTKKGKKRAAK